MTRVRVPSPLFSYTGDRSELEAEGITVGAILDDLERRHAGLRRRLVDDQDRIRPTILIYVSGRKAGLATPIGPSDDVLIVAALSGG